MLLERTPTRWSAGQHGVPTNYRAEPLVDDAPTHAAPANRVSQSMSTTDADAPPAQSVAEHGTTRTSVREDVQTTPETCGARTAADDQHVALMSVADVLALAPTAGATGAMEGAAGVAPPPPAQSSAATAAPNTTTIYTAAASAAEGAQFATGLYQYPERDSDVEAGGIESDGAEDEGADDNDGFFYGSAPFLAHPFSVFGAGSAWPTLAAGIDNGGVEDIALSKTTFTLSPVDWSRVDAAGRYDHDASMASDED